MKELQIELVFALDVAYSKYGMENNNKRII